MNVLGPLPKALVTQILDKLEVSASSFPDLTGLTHLYRAWCRHVPFDNIHYLLDNESRRAVQPSFHLPEEFFVRWLATGVGNMCIASSHAWFALLSSLSYEARLIVSSIDEGRTPNHITVLVNLRNRDYIVDTVNLCETPLVLTSERQRYNSGIHEAIVEPFQESWRVLFRAPATRQQQCCVLLDEYSASSVNACGSPSRRDREIFRSFDRCNYSRLNTRDGVIVVIGSDVVRTDVKGTPRRDISESLQKVLTTELGYSADVARSLPIVRST